MANKYQSSMKQGGVYGQSYNSPQIYQNQAIYNQQPPQMYPQRQNQVQNSAYYPSRPQQQAQMQQPVYAQGQQLRKQPHPQASYQHSSHTPNIRQSSQNNDRNMGFQDPRQRQQYQQHPPQHQPHPQMTKLPALPQKHLQQQQKQHTQRQQHLTQAQKLELPTVFPKGKLYHKLMHTDHSEEQVQKVHPYYPEHMTTVRIRTPSRWGPSRIATPFEVRSSMTTEERYNLNPTKTKSQVGFDYEPYSHTDYKNMMSRYQNMYLPRGLGHTENERWRLEQEKRARMKSYAATVKEMEQEQRERLNRKRNGKRPTTAAQPQERWVAAV